MSQQPLYRIVYADGPPGALRTWAETLRWVRLTLRLARVAERDRQRSNPPVRVERVSPAPRATGGER